MKEIEQNSIDTNSSTRINEYLIIDLDQPNRLTHSLILRNYS